MFYRIKMWFLLILFFLVTVSCGPSISYDRDFDPAYSFEGLKTYKWKPIMYPKNGANRINRFKRAINQQLILKGLEEKPAEADFEISIRGFQKPKAGSVSYGYSYGSYWGGRNVYVATYYQEGTVIIEFIDAKKKEVFWQGVVQGMVGEDLSIQEQDQKFEEIAENLLYAFPPVK